VRPTDITRFAADAQLAQSLLRQVNARIHRPVNFMEVCGTHTMAFSASGLRRALDPRLRLISGPGCPVCVTAQEDLDLAIGLAHQPGVIITTFGDMMRVPGTETSLERAAAGGLDVRVIYSPLDAVQLSREHPDRTIVFLGVGFETTAPTIAAAVKRAQRLRLTNFRLLSLLKTMPEALRAVAHAPGIDGFILPGHVSTIIGAEPYQFLAREFGKPSCIVGFELLDLVHGILMLLQQLQSNQPAQVQNQYKRSTLPQGNPEARKLLNDVFRPCTVNWRGLGPIPGSGLALRANYRRFDALHRFALRPRSARPPKHCRCGHVLIGAITPTQCPMFGRSCTPEHPLGPCMVSSEGACAAYYKYEL
jgi:hydrogenase expression/formation protein HypD